MLRELGDERARALRADVAHERRRRGAARGLAGLGGVALGLEEVVDDLEREADVARVRAQRRELLLARAADDGAELGRGDEERARLARVDRLEAVERRVGGARLQVQRLARREAEKARRVREARDEVERGSGRQPGAATRVEAGLGERPERAHEERDRGEDRDALAVRPVERRAAPARRRVVHRREVVEDERRRVDHLDRGARVDELGARRAEEVAREDDERRPDALARREQGLADGGREGVEGVRLPFRRREEAREARVDPTRTSPSSFARADGGTGVRRSSPARPSRSGRRRRR